jgi:hypothetical protein
MSSATKVLLNDAAQVVGNLRVACPLEAGLSAHGDEIIKYCRKFGSFTAPLKIEVSAHYPL